MINRDENKPSQITQIKDEGSMFSVFIHINDSMRKSMGTINNDPSGEATAYLVKSAVLLLNKLRCANERKYQVIIEEIEQ